MGLGIEYIFNLGWDHWEIGIFRIIGKLYALDLGVDCERKYRGKMGLIGCDNNYNHLMKGEKLSEIAYAFAVNII